MALPRLMSSPRPHDLLRLADGTALEAPPWVCTALARAPWVVVRRAAAPPGCTAVGVRGPTRAHRHAAVVHQGACQSVVTPEQLTVPPPLKSAEVAALQAFRTVAAPLTDLGLPWGPTGSVGFELATGMPTATATSDLDVVVRVDVLDRAGRRRLADLQSILTASAVRVDCQLDTPHGAIMLSELMSGAAEILVKAATGPRLVAVADLIS